MSSFEDFHDGEWLEKIFDLVKSTWLESIVEEFAAHWWGSARAFILPSLLVNGVYDGVYAIIPPDRTRQDVWDDYLKHNEFKVAVWKLAESMYCSIYYAYENLIVNILKKVRESGVRVTDKDFNKVLIEVYGDKLTNRVWTSNFVSVSREVRNCIVHNGGKTSDRLLRMQPLPLVKDGEVMISASDTRRLYNALKPLVYEILSESLNKL